MKKIKAIVSGKVQGVCYRMCTQKKAQQLGVKGYVRNLSNGDVEIVAIGEETAIDTLIKWAFSGSPSAVVSDVKVKIITDELKFEGFKIRY